MIDLGKLAERLLAFWKMQGTQHDTQQSEPAPAGPVIGKSPAPDSNSPRGIRNFNPGNLRPGPQPWVGQIGNDGGYCVFDTAEHGIRALAKLLLVYQDKYGLCTVTAILYRWAPPSENNVAAYISAVCADTGFGADDWLHLHEPSVLAAMVKAIIHHENGIQPYAESLINAAVADALT
jgi:hypothetical protein